MHGTRKGQRRAVRPGTDGDDRRASIEPIEIQEEMERSFLEYSMSVIVARALPDVRDGLKPVHRRILYAMYDTGLRPDRPHVKCAKVVGDVMGRFHPHGDSAIYDALARMAQDFSLRHPLIDGHGNFGCTGSRRGPAAMRYTECRLAPLAIELLDAHRRGHRRLHPELRRHDEEPVVLPARFPNLLVNGSQGIAVGMATNIPPHNLGEVIDATAAPARAPGGNARRPDAVREGPRLPDRRPILGRQGILDAYRTGRGSIKTRAVAEIEEIATGPTRIVVTEIPYQTSVAGIERRSPTHRRRRPHRHRGHQNVSAGRSPASSSRLKRDANANVVLNNLYKHTPLQTSFGVNMLALVDGVPRTLQPRPGPQGLRRAPDRGRHAASHSACARPAPGPHRRGTAQGDRHARPRDRDHPRLGRPPDARDDLMAEPFSFSEEQANHILDMTLGRLTRSGAASSKRRWPSCADDRRARGHSRRPGQVAWRDRRRARAR